MTRKFLEILVINSYEGVPIHELEDSAWDLVLTVNLKSAFWMCKYVLPHMIKKQKGSIINNSSIQGINSQVSDL